MPEPSPAPQHILAVEAMLHGLIRSRSLEFNAEFPPQLPSLIKKLEQAEYEFWFPVPGMVGGFKINLEKLRGPAPFLITESWCRVCGGSEQTHRITASEITLLPEED